MSGILRHRHLYTSMKEMVGGCCVCSDDRGWTENPLVYCDGQMCTVAVHQACYGIVTVPTGNWYCRKCESQERTARVRCELCPSKDGALKRTDNNGWAHVVCALYIPEVRFGNVTSMEPILLQQIPPERFNKSCYICEESGKGARSTIGACMQCNKSGCKQQFHVTCAQALGLLCEEAGNYLDNVKYCGYCQHHYSKLKKTGNVKTIPPYRPIPPDNASDSSSPEKDAGEGWGKPSAKRKLSAGSKSGVGAAQGNAGLKTPLSVSPGPSTLDLPSAPGDDVNINATGGSAGQMKDILPAVSQVKSDSSVAGKFTTANFTEGTVAPNEGGYGEVGKGKKRKTVKDDPSALGSTAIPSGVSEESKSKFKSDTTGQEGIQPASVVVKLPVANGAGGVAASNPPVSSPAIPGRIVTTSSLSPATSSIVVSVPLTAALPSAQTATPPVVSTTTPNSMLTTAVTTAVTPSTNAHTNVSTEETSPSKRGRSQSSDKDKGRNKKRGGISNVGSKGRGGRPNQTTPPPSTAAIIAATTSTTAVTTVSPTITTPAATSVVTSVALAGAAVVSQASAPASVVAHSSSIKESPPSSPDARRSSSGHKSRKHQIKEEKDIKDVKLFQNGMNAPHMLGNQLNPSSTMAQKMSDTLNQELEAHSIFTNDANLSSLSTTNLVGPQLHSRVIASVRSSSANSSNSGSSSTNAGLGWGSSAQGQVPQTLDQLLERQWEQGSQFLMEQAQHFDIASLLSCLHQLRAENLRLEEHVNSLVQRRDHLLAVNARLAIPLTQVNNVHPSAAGVQQQGQQVPPSAQAQAGVDSGRSSASSGRMNSSYPPAGPAPPHSMENGLPPSPPTTAYRASQPSPSTISRHHSPGSASYATSTPGVVVPRGSVPSADPHRQSDGRRSNQPQGGPPPQPQPGSYPSMYQVPPQQQMVMRREVVADLHGQIPPSSKPS